LLGDGEMQEGQVWECLMSAGKFLPGNLIFILDYNKGQIDGPVAEVMNLEPIAEKIKAFNLDVKTVDGHDLNQLKEVMASIDTQVKRKPTFIVAHTLKGKGVSFIEHPNKWHGAAPNKEQLEQAVLELWDGKKSPVGRLIGEN
jgi:transketolase